MYSNTKNKYLKPYKKNMFIVDEDENNLSVWAMLNTPYLLLGVLLKK